MEIPSDRQYYDINCTVKGIFNFLENEISTTTFLISYKENSIYYKQTYFWNI